MEINYLLIFLAVIMIFCTIRGARKGVLRLIYGLIAWIFLICFINYAGTFLENYFTSTTTVPDTIQEKISDYLLDRYNNTESVNEGTGEAALYAIVPPSIRDNITESVQSSIEATITAISKELTTTAIRGLSTIIAIIIGVLIIYIISRAIQLLGLMPGIKDVNRLFGLIAGFIEGLLVIWLLMFVADCFPASSFGQFFIQNVERDQMIYFIYQNNIIEQIIGI